MAEAVVFWAMTYPVGMLLALMLVLGRISRIIKVSGWNNIPQNDGGVLLLPNHPSLLEPILMIALFFPGYLRHPRRLGPFTMADKKNYTHKWYYAPVRSKLLTIHRSKELSKEAAKTNAETLTRAIEILKGGGRIILFGEGGRTPTGEIFLRSRSGKLMRPFIDGAAIIALRSKATPIPVWVEIEWIFGFQFTESWWLGVPKSIRITIGKPIVIEGRKKIQEVTEIIQAAIFEVADEAT